MPVVNVTFDNSNTVRITQCSGLILGLALAVSGKNTELVDKFTVGPAQCLFF